LAVVILLVAGAFWWIAPQNVLLVGALLGSGLALPFMTFLWLIRRMCYVLQRPSIALLGSGFYVCFVVSGLFLLHQFHRTSPLTAFALMSVGSVLSAWVLWQKLHLKGDLQASPAQQRVM